MLAAQNSDFEAVKILVNAGADLNIVNDIIYSPLHWAAKNNNFAMTKFLIEKGCKVDRVCSNKTPLMIASDNGSKEVAELLIKSGSDVDIKINNSTPLNIACDKSHFELVKVLVSSGADVNSDVSLLFKVVKAKNYQITEHLLTHGIKNIDVLSCNGTLLFFAIKNQDINVVKLLLQLGASTNFIWRTKTPFGSAVKTSNLDLIEAMLLSNKVDINDPCNGSLTPVEVAVFNNNVPLMKLLLKYKADIDFLNIERNWWFISYVGFQGSIEMLKLLMGENIDPNYNDPTTHKSLLHLAVKDNSLEKAQFIILKEDFVSIDALANGQTALDIAVENKYNIQEMVNLLLNSGIDVNVGQNQNVTNNFSLVKQHMTKLKAIGYPLRDQNLNIISENDVIDLNNLYIECLKEIELTKNVKIDGTKLSYYNILHFSQHNIAIRLNNFSVKKLKEDNMQISFPLYGSMIYYRLVKGCQRKNLLDLSIEALGKMLYKELPIDVVREINIYLNNKDLKMLTLCDKK